MERKGGQEETCPALPGKPATLKNSPESELRGMIEIWLQQREESRLLFGEVIYLKFLCSLSALTSAAGLPDLTQLIAMIRRRRWCIGESHSAPSSSSTLSGSLGFVTGRKQTLPLRKHASLLGHFLGCRWHAKTTDDDDDDDSQLRAREAVRACVFRVERLIAPLGWQPASLTRDALNSREYDCGGPWGLKSQWHRQSLKSTIMWGSHAFGYCRLSSCLSPPPHTLGLFS